MNSIQRIIEEDEASLKKERRVNLIAAPLQMILFPLLVYSAAFGKTPIVRAGYALMAAGIAISLFAFWVSANWSRQALPGSADMRSQLQRAAFLLSRQASLASTSPVWVSPVFIGAALIWVWILEQNGSAPGLVGWTLLVIVWLTIVVCCIKKARAFAKKKARMEELLAELE